MSSDVHKSLSHWQEYYKQLKTREAFLRTEECRRRFVWTCLRGTQLAGQEFAFRNFKGSLYEQRWHEAVSFLKHLQPLLQALRRAWDEPKYVRGVDLDGNARPAQAAAQARHDQIAGLHAFDPNKMTWIINRSSFHMYTKSMMLIEEIPDMLARAPEACPCHRDLFPHHAA